MSRLEQLRNNLREDVEAGNIYRFTTLSNKAARRLLPSKCELRSIRRRDALLMNVKDYLDTPASSDKIARVFAAAMDTVQGSTAGDPSALDAQIGFLTKHGVNAETVLSSARRMTLVA